MRGRLKLRDMNKWHNQKCWGGNCGTSFYGQPKPHLLQLEAFLANVNSCSCSLFVVVRPSVCRLSSVCLSSVTFVHPTQAIEIFGNVSAPCNTLVT